MLIHAEVMKSEGTVFETGKSNLKPTLMISISMKILH